MGLVLNPLSVRAHFSARLFPVVELQCCHLPYMAGYFAFPPPSFAPNSTISTAGFAPEFLHTDTHPRPRPTAGSNRTWEEKQKREAELRRRKLEQEREQALEGEMDWVSVGGWLRDAYGRKDRLRTEQLRAQARVRDEKRRIIAQWDAYEAQWRALLASTGLISFANIPWPVTSSPTSVDNLTPDDVAEFFIAPLRVSANGTSRKDRIRTSLLRWHPDKLSAVLARTVEQDSDCVRSGINTVFRILKDMQDYERQH